MQTRNSPDLSQALAEAKDIARNVNHTYSTTHLLLALFTLPNAADILLREKDIDEDRILGLLTRVEQESEAVVEDLVQRAHTLARQVGTREASCLHLLVAILRAREVGAHQVLLEAGLDIVSLRNQAMSYLTGHMPRRLRDIEAVRAAQAEQPVADTRAGAKGLSPGLPPEARQQPTRPGPGQPELPLDRPPPDAPKEGRRTPRAVPPPRNHRQGADPPSEPPTTLGKYELDPIDYPWLSSLGRNLTQLAHDGGIDPLIGREQEVDEVIDILGKRRTNNPILVGEPGVGKTAIVEGLASALLSLGSRAGRLREKLVIELDMASILAGTHLRGSFSEKLNGIKEEVRKSGGRIIVFIDEIHTLVGAGATGDGPQDAANELKAALARGEFPCVGATTHDEYRKFIESDPALERRFTPVLVREPTVVDTVRILEGLVEHYAEHHRVKYEHQALEAAASLSARYVMDRFLPDKALAVVDLAGSRACREGRKHVGPTEIAKIVSKIAKVPEERLLMTDRERFLEMESALSKRLVGHDHIIQRTADVVRRNYAGFSSERPMGSFILLGPTGVGKTELARTLADFLFGSRDALIRCDMSEFAESNTVARLVGAPPGYVGYGEGGQLTEPVRRRPFSVVLLDEVEKAHRDVLQVLLQILDEGHLTDGRGRQVSFANTLVLMTSNLGSEVFTSGTAGRVGFLPGGSDGATAAADQSDRVRRIAQDAFPPELWNRIDERLVFEPLSREQIAQIARILIAESSARLEAEKKIRYDVEPAVIEYLIESGGYDKNMGARPMRRVIERLLESVLAERILTGKVVPGDDVRVRLEGDKLAFEVGGRALAAGQ